MDPHLQSALKKSLPQLGHLPPGAAEQLFPQQGSSDDIPTTDSGGSNKNYPKAKKERKHEDAVQPSPTRHTEHSDDHHDDEHEDDDHGDGGHHANRPELAVLFGDPQENYTPHEVDRQHYEGGPYEKTQVIHGAQEVFVNDYLTHFTEEYEDVADTEDIVWIFKSPNAANNAIHLPQGDCAAAYQWKYKAEGASTSDFKSKYTLQVKVWSQRWPHGKVIHQVTEATKLCCLKPHCSIAPRDLGTWDVLMFRNGTQDKMLGMDVQSPVRAEEDGLSRRLDHRFAPLDDGGAMSSDSWLHNQKTYTPKPPDRHGRQKMAVEWSFRSPNAATNQTKFRSALSLTKEYRSDGTTSTLTGKIYDSLYPKGHTYEVATSNGRLTNFSLEGGPGLPDYGDWKVLEKINGHNVSSQTVQARQLFALVSTPAENIQQNNGSIAYQVNVGTLPESWNPGNIAWKLRLRNEKDDTVMAAYEGLFLEQSGVRARTAIQSWDGLDDSNGTKPAPGTSVHAELEVSLLTPSASQVSQLRASAELGTGQRVAAASEPAGDFYTLEGADGLPIDIDDDLYLYLDDERTPIWRDDDGTASLVLPRFRARPLQRLRIVAVDTAGLCRHISGPIYLRHEASGQRQQLRRFNFDDGCNDWPVNTVFLDIAYTIVIPSNASDQVATRAYLVSDCLSPQLSTPAKELFNRNVTGFFTTPRGPGCQIIDTKPNQGVRLASAIDTSVDARGKDAYPFPKIEFCSPVPLGLDPTNGQYGHRFVDLSIPTRGLPLNLGRNYVSQYEPVAPHYGWRWDFEEKMVLIPGVSQALLRGADGNEVVFNRGGADGVFSPMRPEQSEKLRQLDDRHYEIQFRDQTVHQYVIPAGIGVSTAESQTAVLHKKIDRNGNAQTYYWNAEGTQLNKIQGPVAEQFLKFKWSNKRLEQVTDHTGRCVRYGYSKVAHLQGEDGYDWLLTKVVQPGQTTLEHSYHQVLGEHRYRLLDTRFNGELQEKIGACDEKPGVLEEVSHHATTLKYKKALDEYGRYYTEVTKYGSMGMPDDTPQKTTNILDPYGRNGIVIDPDGVGTTIDYDSYNNVRGITDKADNRTNMVYDTRHNLLSTVDPLGRTTTIDYDDKNNPFQIKNAKGEYTYLGYDSKSNLTFVSDNIGHQSTASYNAYGQLESVTNNAGVSWTFGYNALGFLNRKTIPATSDGQPATSWNYVVDSLGRTTRTTDVLGRVSTAKYDERNRMVEATVPAVTARYRQEEQCSAKITNEYDRNDLLLSSTSIDGLKTTYEYDDCQMLTAVHQPGYPRPTKLEYDSFENLVKMTNTANQVTSYRYDIMNRSVGITYPNSDTETFGYDIRSNLISWDRGGQVTSYEYDELSRLKSLNSPATNDLLSWTYDELDRVTKMSDSSGADTTYTYTANDLVDSIFRSDGKGISYIYDFQDRLQAIRDHEGDVTEYQYNERNELKAAIHQGQTIAYSYDRVGRRIGTELPNGIRSTQSFDERNRLLYLNYQKGNNPVLTYKYGHNQLGQRIVEEKNSAEQSKLSRYCYNTRRELTQSDRKIGSRPTVVTKYQYDLNHNRTAKNQFVYTNALGDQLTAYTAPSGNTSLSYNAQGQATSVGSSTYSYNQDQQIKEAVTPEGTSKYFYDGAGRRVAKEVNGTRSDYLLMGSEVLKTYENGAPKAEYFLGLGRHGIKTNNAWKYYLTDGLGSTVSLTDDTGSTVAAYDYDDYGETSQIAGSTSVYNPFLYTGQEWDSELGMYNLRARHYSPSLGRFIARDPIGHAGGSNLYSYCSADPIGHSDPDGMAPSVAIGLLNSNLSGLGASAWARLAANLTSELGFDVKFSAGCGKKDETRISIEFLMGLGDYDQKGVAGSTLPNGEHQSKIFVENINKYILPTIAGYAAYGSRGLETFILNAMKHEIGHSLSLINDPLHLRDKTVLDDYTLFSVEGLKGLLPYSPSLIASIKKKVENK